MGDTAVSTATPASQRTPQVVGAAFVQQYYHVLHKTPEMVHKFYQDCSILSRPDSSGEMLQVTTLKAINDEVLSFKFNSYIAEIETVDSVASYKEGVFIVVTGCLTASDNVRRKFTQSFFLAPQDKKGYFVLTDIFRFVDHNQLMESNHSLASGENDDASKASFTASPEPSLVEENNVQDIATMGLEGDHVNHEEALNPSESYGSGVEDEAAVVSPACQNQSNDQPICKTATPVVRDSPNDKTAASVVQDNGAKKSYASIVKVMGSTPPKKSTVPATKLKARAATPSTQKPSNTSDKTATASELKVPSSNNGPDNNSLDEGYSIHIANLPSNSTTELVEEEFKKFGPIKPGGIQVRNHKSLDSMQAAIKASPISIGGRPTFIEEKRTTTRVVNGVVINWRGRYPSGRSGFRNDNFKGSNNFRGNDYYRGNDNNYRGRGGSFGGNGQGYARMDFDNRGDGHGYARMDFNNRGDYPVRGRGRGPPGTGREGYQQQQQRPIPNGNGRMSRPVAVTA